MDTKKLAKIIKIIVERELNKTLPALIEEGVKKEMEKMLTESTPKREVETVEQDPFSLANAMLEEDRVIQGETEAPRVEQKQYSKNPVINEILNKTKPFTDRGTPPQYNNPAELMTENFNDMDKTLSFDSNIGAAGMDGMKAQMKQKMGYGAVNTSTPSKQGLGVSTGLPGLDRILNRDNSELVKKFKTR